MFNKGIVMASALLLTSLPCFAMGEAFLVAGFGNKSCGDFLASSQNSKLGRTWTLAAPSGVKMWDEKLVYLEWARGFVTGTNQFLGRQSYDKNTEVALEAWLVSYCGQHPTALFAIALVRFLTEEGALPK